MARFSSASCGTNRSAGLREDCGGGAGRGAADCSFHGSCCNSPVMPCFCMAWLMVYTALPASERAAAPLPMQSSARTTFLSMSPPNMYLHSMGTGAWTSGGWAFCGEGLLGAIKQPASRFGLCVGCTLLQCIRAGRTFVLILHVQKSRGRIL